MLMGLPGRAPWKPNPGAGHVEDHLELEQAQDSESTMRGSVAQGPSLSVELQACGPVHSRGAASSSGGVSEVADPGEEPAGSGLCRERGSSGWSLRRGGSCAVPGPPALPADPAHPRQGHDGHAWRLFHPGWRGPRAPPALQSELRPHGQGGWAPRPSLGAPLRAPGATPPCTLFIPGGSLEGTSPCPALPSPSSLWDCLSPSSWLLGAPGREGRVTAPDPPPPSRELSRPRPGWERGMEQHPTLYPPIQWPR